MIGARIKCDNCQFVGDMKFTANCSTTIVAPDGWATVSATIRIKGEINLKREERIKLKAKIKEKTPPFHVCPGCISGNYEVRLDRLLGNANGV